MTETIEKTVKPLGKRSYGSIPHLPGSRRGPKDYGVNEGQMQIATRQARDKHDLVIVQEKLDGSNVGVAKVNGIVTPIIRAGYRAEDSRFLQHIRFAEWVYENQDRFDSLLNEGERVCGEWLYQAHGTLYILPHEPFVAFDIMTGSDRLAFEEFRSRVEGKFTIPKTLHVGGPIPISEATKLLGKYGHHGATDPVEGAVWRVERKGKVDFLCKFVRLEKVDGLYLSSVSGEPDILNQWPESSLLRSAL